MTSTACFWGKISIVRILQVSSAKTFGGGERHFVDLARGLVERGHEVFVALRPTNEWDKRLSFLPRENFLYVSIRNSFGMFSARRIARFIEQNRIDVVHAHVARDYLASSVAVRSSSRSRLVLTRHVVFPLKPFHRFALRNVSAAIAVSPKVREQLERIFVPRIVHTIPNGLSFTPDSDARNSELSREFRELHSIPGDAPLITTLGELKLLKGQRDLVLAAAELHKRRPDVRFVIAGKDNSMDQHFRREIKRLSRVLGLDGHIVWLDWLDDIRPLLAATDIFVSPSHSESFGLAILDAMAAGTPVIATETDGARELITDSQARVPIKDPLELAARIEWYLAHPDDLRRLAEGQRLRALENFGLESMLDATENVYRLVTGG